MKRRRFIQKSAGISLIPTIQSSAASGELPIQLHNGRGKTDQDEDVVTRRWTWTIRDNVEVRSSPTITQGFTFFGGGDNLVYAIDFERGTKQWTFETGDSVWSSPAVDGASVYVGSNDSSIYALDLLNGTKQWQFETEGAVQSSPTVIDNKLFVGSNDGYVYAIDTESGEEKWNFGSITSVTSSPIISNGKVLIGGKDNKVYAIDTQTGDELWKFETSGPISSSPTVFDSTVIVGSDDNHVYALNLESGNQSWKFETNGSVQSSPTVTNSTVFAGSNDNHLYALDFESGMKEWDFQSAGSVRSSPTVANGTVIFASVSNDEDRISNIGNVHMLDVDSGTEEWTNGYAGKFYSSPTVVEGIAYISATPFLYPNGYVIALDTNQVTSGASSEGTRVNQGSLGHHHSWSEDPAPSEYARPKLAPDNKEQQFEETGVIDLLIKGGTNGVSSYTLDIQVDNPEIADIIGCELIPETQSQDVMISEDGSFLEIDAVLENSSNEITQLQASIEIEGLSLGETSFSISNCTITDSEGQEYIIFNQFVCDVTVSDAAVDDWHQHGRDPNNTFQTDVNIPSDNLTLIDEIELGERPKYFIKVGDTIHATKRFDAYKQIKMKNGNLEDSGSAFIAGESSPAYLDERLITDGPSNRIWAHNPVNLDESYWHETVGSSWMLTADGVVFSGNTSTVRAMYSDGEIRWIRDLESNRNSLAYDDGILYFTTGYRFDNPTQLYGLDAKTGETVLQSEFSGNFSRTPPSIMNNKIIVGRINDYIAIDKKSGEKIWEAGEAGGQRYHTNAVIDKKYIYTNEEKEEGSNIVKRNPKNGAEMWKLAFDNWGILVGGENHLIFMKMAKEFGEGETIIINKESGKIAGKWEEPETLSASGTNPIPLEGGMLIPNITGSESGKIYWVGGDIEYQPPEVQIKKSGTEIIGDELIFQANVELGDGKITKYDWELLDESTGQTIAEIDGDNKKEWNVSEYIVDSENDYKVSLTVVDEYEKQSTDDYVINASELITTIDGPETISLVDKEPQTEEFKASSDTPKAVDEIKWFLDSEQIGEGESVELTFSKPGENNLKAEFIVGTQEYDQSIGVSVIEGPPPVVGDSRPQDLNGDGLYEDIDGDGEFDIFDVQALFEGLNSDPVQNNPAAFNFNDDEDPTEVTIFDVQGLFELLD